MLLDYWLIWCSQVSVVAVEILDDSVAVVVAEAVVVGSSGWRSIGSSDVLAAQTTVTHSSQL